MILMNVQVLMDLLVDDVQVDVRSFREKTLDGQEIQVLAQAVESRAAEHGLGDAMLGDECGGSGGDVLAWGKMDDVGTQVLRELDAGLQVALALCGLILLGLDVENIEFSPQPLGQPGATGNQVSGLRTGADAYGHLLRDRPVRAKLLALDVVIQGSVDGAGDAMQRHLTQGNQVTPAEEVGKSTLGAVDRVNVAALHACDQGLGRQVGDDDLVSAVKNPVWNRLADGDSGEALNAGGKAFNVLYVDGAEDVDVGLQNEEDVFISFGVAAACDVGVG